MNESQQAVQARFPQPGDVVLYGASTGTEGNVKEVPAMIVEVQVPGAPASRVDLVTVKVGIEHGAHSGVRYAAAAEQGCWRWRPGR